MTHRELAEAGWRWVLDQVQWADDGPWIPEVVTAEPATEIPDYRDGMHSGIGGLAHVLAEIRLTRPWTDEEQVLADGIAARVRGAIAGETNYQLLRRAGQQHRRADRARGRRYGTRPSTGSWPGRPPTAGHR